MERLWQEGKNSWTDLLNTVNPRLCKNIRIGDASILILRLFEFCVVFITFHGCRWQPWSGLKLNIISYMFQKDFSGCKLFGFSTGSSLRYVPCRDFQIAFCFFKSIWQSLLHSVYRKQITRRNSPFDSWWLSKSNMIRLSHHKTNFFVVRRI